MYILHIYLSFITELRTLLASVWNDYRKAKGNSCGCMCTCVDENAVSISRDIVLQSEVSKDINYKKKFTNIFKTTKFYSYYMEKAPEKQQIGIFQIIRLHFQIKQQQHKMI